MRLNIPARISASCTSKISGRRFRRTETAVGAIVEVPVCNPGPGRKDTGRKDTGFVSRVGCIIGRYAALWAKAPAHLAGLQAFFHKNAWSSKQVAEESAAGGFRPSTLSRGLKFHQPSSTPGQGLSRLPYGRHFLRITSASGREPACAIGGLLWETILAPRCCGQWAAV